MDRQAHLGTLRICNWILGALACCLALVFLLVWCLPGLLAILHGEAIGWVFLLGGLAFGGLAGGLGWLHFRAATGTVLGKRRLLQSVLAILHVVNMPIGTAFAVYTLWVCWFHQPTKVFFDIHDDR